jgi:hypothetical protein
MPAVAQDAGEQVAGLIFDSASAAGQLSISLAPALAREARSEGFEPPTF